jgi:hypothetical protein
MKDQAIFIFAAHRYVADGHLLKEQVAGLFELLPLIFFQWFPELADGSGRGCR